MSSYVWYVILVLVLFSAGGQCEYRRALPPSFLFKFFVEVSIQLEALSLSVVGPDGDLPPAPIIGDSDRQDWFLCSCKKLTIHSPDP